MKNITDDDLTMLYYGEHDDPTLAATVAGSAELTARFDALGAELSRIDLLVPPARSDDYGPEVWRRISPRLDASQKRPVSAWQSWISVLRQPRFSWASAASLMLVALLAFMLGRQGNEPYSQAPATVQQIPSMPLEGLDPTRLLTASVSNHLDQLNLAFTEFAHSSQTSDTAAGQITDLLVANRLYRQAAISRGDHQLAAFLGGLEPVLIELAHEAQTNSPVTRARMQQEIKDKLLFRIRVMNKQLDNPNIST
jgi:hypothetical protein